MKLWCGAVAWVLAGVVAAAEPVPRFEDAGRRARIEALRPKIEAIYREAAAQHHLPGVVHGIVLDGELIHAAAFGLADTETKRPVTLATRFRVASMSKSFTALAILRLRDAGKLALSAGGVASGVAYAVGTDGATDAVEAVTAATQDMFVGKPEF